MVLLGISDRRQERKSSPEKFQNRQYDIIDIAEPACLSFLCVMQSSAPIDRYIRRSDIQLSCCRKTGSCILLAKVEEATERGAVVVSDSMCVDLCLGW